MTFRNRIFTLISLASFSFFSPHTSYALEAASIDSTNTYPGIGYSAKVLDIILNNWYNPDTNAQGQTGVLINIAPNGKPYSCEVYRSSSSLTTDNSICATVANIGEFPKPSQNQNSELALTFFHTKDTIAPAFSSQTNATLSPSQNNSNLTSSPTPSQEQGNLASELTLNSNSSSLPETDTFNSSVNTNTGEDLAVFNMKDAPNTNSTNADSNLQTSHAKARQSETPEANQNINPQTSKYESVDDVLASLALIGVNEENQKASVVQNMADTKAIPNTTSNTTSNVTATDLSSEENVITPKAKKNSFDPSIHYDDPEDVSSSTYTAPVNDLATSNKLVKEYSQNIFNQARAKINTSTFPKGKYQVIAMTDLQHNGTLIEATIYKSSGVATIDEEILRVLRTEVKYPKLPDIACEKMWLTFNVHR